MKYTDEYRQPDLVKHWARAIQKCTTKEWTIMEVCGGQTHAIMKFGLHALLPKTIRLIHGPGCPVCVTPINLIDHAIHIASLPNTIVCSFGDMLRVPGSVTNLLTMKAKGADIRLIYSPLEALEIAKNNPHKQIVFFAIGFETTAPANGMAVYQAKERNITNFSLLSAHVLVLPALHFLKQQPGNEVQGFLAAGHVCTVTGYKQYHSLKLPIVVTGFEPVDILQGIYTCIQLLEHNECHVVNQYRRSVNEQGNIPAQNIMKKVFQVIDRIWRGIGVIPKSGLDLAHTYEEYNAALRFPVKTETTCANNGCISGLVLQGKKRPHDCPFFGKSCSPLNPLGAPMVSSEGACAAYHNWSS